MLDKAKDKLEWIKKRAPLNTMQDEYVGFMLNQQEQMISLLSAHILACRGHLYTGNFAELERLLDKAVEDIERTGKRKPTHTFRDCKYCDPAQGRNLCVNNRRYVTKLSRRKKCNEICIFFDKR